MASIFDNAANKIKVFKEDKEEGKVNAIPPPFPGLAKVFPGWERGLQTTISAGTGIGKTKIAKYLIITSIAKYISENPDIDVHIRYYALEESEEVFALSFISTMLAMTKGITLAPHQLKSLGDYTLTDEELEEVGNATEYLNDFLKHVTVIDNVTNPYGIWKDVRNWTYGRGVFYKDDKSPDGDVLSSTKVTDLGLGWNRYVPNNPKEFVFIITDHISLLSPEKKHDNSLFSAMGEFSKEYCLKYMVKRFNYHVINVQQQTADSDKKQFDMKGQSIQEKLLPTLDGLANNKECARDCDLVIALFAPTRYGLDTFDGYKINPNTGGLGDAYRCMLFLKDRNYGLANSRVHLYFGGAINYFEQLPEAAKMTPQDYRTLLECHTLN